MFCEERREIDLTLPTTSLISAGEVESAGAIECVICLEDVKKSNMGTISCNHQFCFSCIEEWSKKDTVCPLCRAKFSFILQETEGKPKKVPIIRARPVRNHYQRRRGLGRFVHEDDGPDLYLSSRRYTAFNPFAAILPYPPSYFDHYPSFEEAPMTPVAPVFRFANMPWRPPTPPLPHFPQPPSEDDLLQEALSLLSDLNQQIMHRPQVNPATSAPVFMAAPQMSDEDQWLDEFITSLSEDSPSFTAPPPTSSSSSSSSSGSGEQMRDRQAAVVIDLTQDSDDDDHENTSAAARDVMPFLIGNKRPREYSGF